MKERYYSGYFKQFYWYNWRGFSWRFPAEPTHRNTTASKDTISGPYATIEAAKEHAAKMNRQSKT